MPHLPVLLQEALELLQPKPGGFVIDGTVDGGGHARELVAGISPGGTFLGLDWDEAMLARAKAHIGEQYARVILTHGNYADLPEILKKEKLGKADGLTLDLGFSSEQIEGAGRGFSFLRDEPLLMTYDASRPPVRQLLRTLREAALAQILFEFSGERYARRIARAIKERVRKKPIETTGELAAVVEGAVPRHYERGRLHPATRTFQALRIYANEELANLEKFLGRLGGILRVGGRVTITSFHSLEDKLVKTHFRQMEKEGQLHILTKKPLRPSREEVASNPRSRSARLRAAELLNTQ